MVGLLLRIGQAGPRCKDAETETTMNSFYNLHLMPNWYEFHIFKDVLTDLKADADVLPVEPVKEDWLAHKVRVVCIFKDRLNFYFKLIFLHTFTWHDFFSLVLVFLELKLEAPPAPFPPPLHPQHKAIVYTQLLKQRTRKFNFCSYLLNTV